MTSAVSACAPLLTHGPRVVPGVHIGIHSGLTLMSTDSLPSKRIPGLNAGVHLAYGWRVRQDSAWGMRVAAQLGLYGRALDLYAEFPVAPFGSSHTGAGVFVQHFSRYGAMPYVMTGWTRADGTVLYAGQGLGFIPTAGSARNRVGMSLVGAQPLRSVESSVYLMALYGPQDSGCERGTGWCRNFTFLTRVQLGASVDLRRPRRRGRPLPR